VSRRRADATVAEVLAGRVPLDPGLLVRLIHSVNPTERGLPPAVEARRYTEKSALQSLLIERFPDDVKVVPHGGPGVVSLRLGTGRDAGHAPLAALSPDARSWVQNALDLAHLPTVPSITLPPPRVAPEPPEDGASLLERGEAALAHYDFEAAEALLRGAVEEAPGYAPATLALLMLWVDALAADDKALALGETTPLTGDPRVQGLLAVAAARAGRQKEALRWLEGLDGARAGEAWGWMGRAALHAADLPAARRALAALEHAQPGGSTLAALRDEVVVLAARLRAPAEAALEAQLPVATAQEVEARARRLLDAHPDSAVAARVLRWVAEQRQMERMGQLVARAVVEVEAGRFGVAAALYREALSLGAPVAEALQATSARAEADRRRSRIEAVTERLADPDEAAFLAWLALEPSERAAVDADRPEVAWLTQMGAPASGSGAKEAVRAARALAQARALMTEAPAVALALVGPHRVRLQGLSDAERLLALADEAVHLGRTARQRDLLEAAAALVRSGDRAAALARLSEVGVDTLGEADHDRLLALRRQIELGDRLAAATIPEARRPLLAELATLDPRVLPRLAAVDEAIARAWGRRIFRDVHAPPACLFTPGSRRDARPWLTRDDQAVLPDLRGPWLLLRWVGAGLDRVTHAVAWHLPRPTRLLDFVVEADGLRLLTEEREVIRFSTDGITLLRHDSLPGPPAQAGLLVPGSDHAWIVDADGTEVFGVAARSRLRRLEGVRVLGTLGGCEDPLVVARGEHTTLHAAGGMRLRDLGQAEGAVTGPGGTPLSIAAEGVDGGAYLEGHGLRPGQATGHRDGATFQLRMGHLWAGDLDWTLHVGADAELLRDAHDHRTAVLVPDAQGLQLRILNPHAPPPLALSPLGRPGPELQPWRARFTGFPVDRLPAVLATQEALRHAPVARWLADARETQGSWADALCHEALRRLDPAAAAMVLDAARRAWPRSGLIGLLDAWPAAEAARWGRARAALEGRTPEPDIALRFYHLLGFARLQTGAPAEAVTAWQAAARTAPDQAEALDGLIAAIAPALEDDGEDDARPDTTDASARSDRSFRGPHPGDAPSIYAACMRALRVAERHRLAGDLPGVVAALDHPWTWHYAELQSLARLAEALLESDPHTTAELLRKCHALVVFVEAAEGGLDLGPERRIVLPLAADRWSAARLEALAERARSWLGWR